MGGYPPDYLAQLRSNARKVPAAMQKLNNQPTKESGVSQLAKFPATPPQATQPQATQPQATQPQATQPSEGNATKQVVNSFMITPGTGPWHVELNTSAKPQPLKIPKPLPDQTQTQVAVQNVGSAPSGGLYKSQDSKGQQKKAGQGQNYRLQAFQPLHNQRPAVQPQVTQHQSNQSLPTQLQESQPQTNQKQVTQQQALQPQETQQQATQTQETQTQVPQQQATQPQVTEQQAIQPQVTQQQAIQPQATQPQTSQSQATESSRGNATGSVVNNFMITPATGPWQVNVDSSSYGKPQKLKTPEPLTDLPQSQATNQSTVSTSATESYNDHVNIAAQPKQVTQPQVGQPQPYVTKPQAIQPQATQPQKTQQQADQPQAFQPQASQEQANKPSGGNETKTGVNSFMITPGTGPWQVILRTPPNAKPQTLKTPKPLTDEPQSQAVKPQPLKIPHPLSDKTVAAPTLQSTQEGKHFPNQIGNAPTIGTYGM